MDDDTTAPLSGRARLVADRFGDWLRSSAPRLYRHDLALDTDALAREVASRFEGVLQAAEESDDPALRDPVTFCQSQLGRLTTELVRGVQSGQVQELGRPVPPASELSPETAQAVERVVATLPSEHQTAAALFLQGFSRPEVVNLTGWSDDEARQRLHDAEKGLREWLDAAGIEYAAD